MLFVILFFAGMYVQWKYDQKMKKEGKDGKGDKDGKDSKDDVAYQEMQNEGESDKKKDGVDA